MGKGVPNRRNQPDRALAEGGRFGRAILTQVIAPTHAASVCLVPYHGSARSTVFGPRSIFANRAVRSHRDGHNARCPVFG